MDWKNWIVLLLVFITASWMLYDGARAFILGDYTTPKTGEYAGQLGPWTSVVKAVGIEPRSTLMKSIFVIYGLAALGIVICFALGLPWARIALIVACILGLWFLPIGTVTNIIALILLLAGRK